MALGTVAWITGSLPFNLQPSDSHKRPNPVFVPLEPFIVTLQPDEDPHYLRAEFAIQVENQDQADLISMHMARIRSRMLLILSDKKAADIATVQGKERLMQELLLALNRPLIPGGLPANVTGIFSTSFLTQ